MNPNREEALFVLALEKPAEKRAAFLDAMCDGDAALRQRLETLLAAHEQPATELAGADASTVKATAIMEQPDLYRQPRVRPVALPGAAGQHPCFTGLDRQSGHAGFHLPVQRPGG